MHHPQVVQPPTFNYCLKVNIDGHTEPKIVPTLILQVSVRELHNSLVSGPIDGRLKEARDEENNIIISNSTLRSLLPPQLKKCFQDTRLCVVVNVAYLPKLYINHYYQGMIGIKKLNNQRQNSQNRRSGEKEIAYKKHIQNTVLPHGRHIYAK